MKWCCRRESGFEIIFAAEISYQLILEYITLLLGLNYALSASTESTQATALDILEEMDR